MHRELLVLRVWQVHLEQQVLMVHPEQWVLREVVGQLEFWGHLVIPVLLVLVALLVLLELGDLQVHLAQVVESELQDNQVCMQII